MSILVNLLEASDLMMLVKELISRPLEAKQLIASYRTLKSQRAENKRAFAKLLVTMGGFDSEAKAIQHLENLPKPQYEKLIASIEARTSAVLNRLIDVYLSSPALSFDQKNELKILRNSLTGDPTKDGEVLKKIDALLPN